MNPIFSFQSLFRSPLKREVYAIHLNQQVDIENKHDFSIVLVLSGDQNINKWLYLDEQRKTINDSIMCECKKPIEIQTVVVKFCKNLFKIKLL